eukprot:1740300-Heterocapsa_arctica.AAC.1
MLRIPGPNRPRVRTHRSGWGRGTLVLAACNGEGFPGLKTPIRLLPGGPCFSERGLPRGS